MDTNQNSTVGIFNDLETAENTVHDLIGAGFTSDEIGIIGHVGAEGNTPTPLELRSPEENVTSGIGEGGLWGAVVGLLVILLIPGLGAVSGGGRWFEVLGGVLLGAAVGGALFAFGSLMLSRPRARFYASELEKGHFIVTVNNPARTKEAAYLLQRRETLTRNLALHH